MSTSIDSYAKKKNREQEGAHFLPPSSDQEIISLDSLFECESSASENAILVQIIPMQHIKIVDNLEHGQQQFP